MVAGGSERSFASLRAYAVIAPPKRPPVTPHPTTVGTTHGFFAEARGGGDSSYKPRSTWSAAPSTTDTITFAAYSLASWR